MAREQLDELHRQRRRVQHRSTVIECVHQAQARVGDSHEGASKTRTMADALAELVADITEAARTIGTILQRVGDP